MSLENEGVDSTIIVSGVVVPKSAQRVVDADEEIFILYSELQAQTARVSPHTEHFRGLGHVDSRKNILTVTIELLGGEVHGVPAETDPQGRKKRIRLKAKKRPPRIPDKSIEVDIAQDTTALRSRKGDTGSVLWHASVDFARSILQQAYLVDSESIFDFEKLKSQHIFELGAGTGVLSLLLSPLCRRYTVTDIPELIPLIQKNITMNFPQSSATSPPNIFPQSFDWVLLKSTPDLRRQTSFPIDDPVDLLLVVDCVYHPSLLPALVETITYLTTPNQTAVFIVSELRSEQVLREFLQLWLALSDWMIYRILDLISGPYVVWIGWKKNSPDASN